MDILESEKNLIEARITELRGATRNAGFHNPITIAGGDPILLSNKEEYLALKNMRDMLEKGIDTSNRFSYLDERAKTNLERLAPEIENSIGKESETIENTEDASLNNNNNILTREATLVQDRMQQLIQDAREADKYSPTTLVNGVSVPLDKREEYIALQNMRNMLERGISPTNRFNYLDERAKTNLERLAPEVENAIGKNTNEIEPQTIRVQPQPINVEPQIMKVNPQPVDIEPGIIEPQTMKVEPQPINVEPKIDEPQVMKVQPQPINPEPEVIQEESPKVELNEKDILAREATLIQERMEQITNDAKDISKYNPTTIADGVSVPLDNKEEYLALKNMKDILEKGINSANRTTYLDERAKTKLPKLEPNIENMLGKSIEGDSEYTNNNQLAPQPTNDNTNDNDWYILEDPVLISDHAEEVKPEEPIEVDFEIKDEQITVPNSQELLNVEPISKPEPDPEPEPIPEPEEEEELFEVKKTTPWQWIKGHKKEIIVGLGITALTVTTVVAITQLMPAIMAATQATNVANIAAQMVTNGQMWFSASAAEQMALHGANTALASQISSLTGLSNVYNTVTGVWTLGSEALPAFAESAALAASSAVEKIATIKTASIIGGLAGLGTIGGGLLIPGKKSKQYFDTVKKIKAYETGLEITGFEEGKQNAKRINDEIMNSDMSKKEKAVLLKKLAKVSKKASKRVAKEQNVEYNNFYEEPQNDHEQHVEYNNEQQKGTIPIAHVEYQTIDGKQVPVGIKYMEYKTEEELAAEQAAEQLDENMEQEEEYSHRMAA